MIACFSSCKMTTDVRLSVTINSFLYEHYVTQHEINNQWRQREFNVGGDEAPKGMGPSPPPSAWEKGLGGKNFCDLEMAYFGDSEVLNLKVFFIQKL